MPGATSNKLYRPRELRRRVMAAARLRLQSGWYDATILNISSRGLQIQTKWPLAEGSWVELRRGNHVIRSQVIWCRGTRAGLRSEERLAVEDIASSEVGTAVRAVAGERRRQPRPDDRDRLRGRVIEFAGVLGIVLVLAAGVLVNFQQAVARPLASVAEVLR